MSKYYFADKTDNSFRLLIKSCRGDLRTMAVLKNASEPLVLKILEEVSSSGVEEKYFANIAGTQFSEKLPEEFFVEKNF